MHRLALVTMASLGACGGGQRATPAPSGQAADLVAVTGCDGATLRAFDPGLPGIEHVTVEPRRAPDAPLAREHMRPCETMEDDDLCRARARRAVLAADPDATIGNIAVEGGAAVEAPPLRPADRRLVAGDGRVVNRINGRSAIVQYEVPVIAVASRVQWEASLRWPLPADVPAALERLQREVEHANLVILRYEVGVDELSADVACP